MTSPAVPPNLGRRKRKTRREDGFIPSHPTLTGTGPDTRGGSVPDAQRSDNGSVSGAVYSGASPFGARLPGPFRSGLGIGLSPFSDSLGLVSLRTRPDHSLSID